MKVLTLDKISLLLGTTALTIFIIIENFYLQLLEDGIVNVMLYSLFTISGLTIASVLFSYLLDKKNPKYTKNSNQILSLILIAPVIIYGFFYTFYILSF